MTKREGMLRLVDQWKKSGLTKTEFLADKAIKESTFNYWVTKNVRAALLPAKQPVFKEVTLGFESTRKVAEIETPAGHIIRFFA
jgi:hypothetical protein